VYNAKRGQEDDASFEIPDLDALDGSALHARKFYLKVETNFCSTSSVPHKLNKGRSNQ
jgi:hypothetical protein